MTDEVRARFIHHCWEFLDGQTDEAQLREDDEIPDFDRYIEIRRKSGFCPVLFDMIEIILGISLPSGVFEDPDFLKVYDAAADIINAANVSLNSVHDSTYMQLKLLTGYLLLPR